MARLVRKRGFYIKKYKYDITFIKIFKNEKTGFKVNTLSFKIINEYSSFSKCYMEFNIIKYKRFPLAGGIKISKKIKRKLWYKLLREYDTYSNIYNNLFEDGDR